MHNRWSIYEMLKGNKRLTITEIEKINAEEIKEGVIEFILSKEKEVEADGE
jgi:hypothetical protein